MSDLAAGGSRSEPEPEWRGDDRLRVGGVDFVLAPRVVRGVHLEAHELLLRKPRWMVECYERLRGELEVERIVELGIFEGGSTVLLAQLFSPRTLVAADLRAEPVEVLERFRTEHGLEASVRPHYGVDQADRAHLERLLDEELGDAPIDLVIDDASHLLEPSTRSFDLLFPRLRPGGLYVLEDWSWQHDFERAYSERVDADPGAQAALAQRLERGEVAAPEVPMSRLLLEAVLTAGYDERVVAEVSHVRRGFAVVRRGPAELDRAEFAIGRAYGNLGRSLLT